MQFKNQSYDIKKRSYKFSLKTIQFLHSLPKNYISQTIGKQLLRSSTSIGANIVEAQAGSSKKDFQNFINHALKSANETLYWLYLLKESIRPKNQRLEKLISEALELSKILGASILKLKGKK